ncbi:hypothetical protein MKW92_030054 [Papaver armeniacum]|nr:hypothetical protein MKW92_030054 [Papaver armeniacum]
MGLYEMMGDTLSLQYGGSLAHCKIFWSRRGHWKAAIHTQDILRSFHRFLGYFKPQQGRPALWELDAYEHSD